MAVEDLYPALQMTDACNKNCPACLRTASTGTGHLGYAVIEKYLGDLRVFARAYGIRHQFVTGGEPTIWKDRESGKDIVDILATLCGLEIVDYVTMPTNGKVFEDAAFAREFFTRLSRQIERPLIVGVSIARYQENLSESGYIALDNLLGLSREPGMRLLPVILVTLSRQDDTDRRLARIYPDVIQRVTPLAPLGGAAGMAQDCPSLSLHGADKSPLGDFLPHFRRKARHIRDRVQRRSERAPDGQALAP